jgi:hypothetical protein
LLQIIAYIKTLTKPDAVAAAPVPAAATKQGGKK